MLVNVFRKLGVRDRAAAVQRARGFGLLGRWERCPDVLRPPSSSRPERRRNTVLRRLTYHDARAAGSPHLRSLPARARDRLGARRAAGAAGELVEVVVSLSQKPLATTSWRAGRQLQARTLANAQASLASSIETAVPDARIRWRYQLVANGMAVVVPRSQLDRLTSLPGVETVYPSVRYRPQLDRSTQQIGAPTLWGPGLTNAGSGDEDRDHRRGDRPDASVLLAGRLHDARRLSRRVRPPTRPRR